MNEARTRRLRRVAGLIGSVVLLSAVIAWMVRPRPIEVRVAQVEEGRFELSIEEEGLTRVRDRFIVSAPIAGQVSRSRLQIGDSVDADQVLAQIIAQPPAMLDWRTLTGLRERAAAAAAAVGAAVASRDRATAALGIARSDLNRSLELAREGFISDAALETSLLGAEERRQALLAAEMAVETAAHEHAAAQAALLQAGAERRTGGETGSALGVKSPVAGRILRVIQENEAYVQAGAPLYEIADPGRLEVVIDVLSQDAASIRVGTAARLSFDLDAPRHPARVRQIEPIARTRVSALGVEEQRVRVILDLEPGAVAPPGDGWRANAALIVLAESPAVMVPNGALVRRGNGWAVHLLEQGRSRVSPVSVAARNPRMAWVREGLSAGQTVILYPPASLLDGARAIPLGQGG
jgi:HlyD family secretion protein